MKSNRILVTGLNGVIGWSVFRAAREQSDAYGTYRKEYPFFLDERFTRVDWDQEDEIQALVEKVRPDYLIHCWAICDLDLCEEIPEIAERINIRCLESLIRVLNNTQGLKKFVYMSTDHVFGGQEGAYTEEDTPEPIHVYGRTKVEAEKRVIQSDLPYMIIRPGLVVGPSLQGNIGPRDFLFSRIRADKPTHYFTDEWRSPICSKQFGQRVLDLTGFREKRCLSRCG